MKAADWILSKQVLGPGDWQVKNKDAEPGGWVFEFRNDFYPDVDDTAFVLMALQRVKFPDPKRMEAAVRRGIQWLLSMQNRDGGWAAFDRDNNKEFLCNIPFADHNAMIDPSTADVTARVLECLGRFGWSANHPAIQRARTVFAERSVRRRLMVRPLGRQLRLRHERRAALTRNGFAHRERILPTRRELAAFRSEGRRKLRRIAAQLSPSRTPRAKATAPHRKQPGA